jgi:putative sigma-54 modulation protein
MPFNEVNEMQVMEIDIRALNFALTLAQHEYIERRLSYALDAHSELISASQVWLSELNDSDSVRNQRCLIQLTLGDGAQVVIDSVEADLYVAIHRAADRASWKVARCFGRSKVRASERSQSSRNGQSSSLRVLYQQSSM